MRESSILGDHHFSRWKKKVDSSLTITSLGGKRKLGSSFDRHFSRWKKLDSPLTHHFSRWKKKGGFFIDQSALTEFRSLS